MKYQILSVNSLGAPIIIPIDGEYDLEQMRCIVKGLEINNIEECTYYIVVEGDK